MRSRQFKLQVEASWMYNAYFSSAFHNCERRMQRANDKQALAARHAIVLDLIANTKLAVRTYTKFVALSANMFFF